MRRALLLITLTALLLLSGCGTDDKFVGVWTYNDIPAMMQAVKKDPFFTSADTITFHIGKSDDGCEIMILQGGMPEMGREYVEKGKVNREDVQSLRNGQWWSSNLISPSNYAITTKGDTLRVKFGGRPEQFSVLEFQSDGKNLRMTVSDYFKPFKIPANLSQMPLTRYTEAEFQKIKLEFQNVRADALEKLIEKGESK